MESGKPVILYTRPGCHLCERVETLLRRLAVDWQPVDIESDSELEKIYGLLIPVVHIPASGQELAFPFDEGSLSDFLKEQGAWSPPLFQ